MSVYHHIAHKDGELFTIWGPCVGTKQGAPGCCVSCDHANALEAAGKDWETEYQAWKRREAVRKAQKAGLPQWRVEQLMNQANQQLEKEVCS